MKVLLVDDEKDIREIGLLSLKAIGKFDTLTAASPEEALETARRELPDLIVTDMLMPGMSGLELLVELRRVEALAATPVIFLTARADRAETEGFIKAGAIGVIHKPFDPMRLPTEIRTILSAARPAV